MSANTMMIVEAFGVTVVEVPGLRVPVGYEPTLGVALINAELDDRDRESALDWILQAAAEPIEEERR